MHFVVEMLDCDRYVEVVVEIPDGWYRVFDGPIKDTDQILDTRIWHMTKAISFIPYDPLQSADRRICEESYRKQWMDEEFEKLERWPDYTTASDRQTILDEIEEGLIDTPHNHICVIRQGEPPYKVCHECANAPAILGEKYCGDCRSTTIREIRTLQKNEKLT